MTVHTFDSLEDLLQAVTQDREAADQCVLPFQAEAKVGDCYVRLLPDEGLVIFGELLDPTADCTGEELAEVRSLYRQPHMRHYRFGRHYSVACEDGELGDIHVANIAAIISRAAFAAAQALGWPCDLVGGVWNQCGQVPKQFRPVAFKIGVENALLTTAQARS
jgi:hypothetical protein